MLIKANRLKISWIHEKKPTMVGVLTGAVAGLATITPEAGLGLDTAIHGEVAYEL
ncbi:hypothetical protein [Desulfosporosinus sp. BG]|uniref:hypothetical protein n=1 Tax=Desulfosporosinus sp. BG TaxID=1633135 RepID=UPI000856A4EA|nr:hypothetical protein [Desulfosporosinus sp. BG]ODA41350.1 Ammonium transporter [Desulfosporosinus sp. BG]